MNRDPSRLRSARLFALPLATLTVVLAVTLLARMELLQVLAEMDARRATDARITSIKPLQDVMSGVSSPLDLIRSQAGRNEPLSTMASEWRARVPFVHDVGYARHVVNGGQEAWVVEFLDSREDSTLHHTGQDLAGDPVQALAVRMARETAIPTSTPLISGAGPGVFVYFQPVYKNVRRPEDPAEQEAALLGMTFATVDPAAAYEKARTSFSPLLTWRLQAPEEPVIKREPLRRTVSQGLKGYQWNIYCEPSATFYDVPQYRLPRQLLIGGLLFGFGLAAWQFKQRKGLDKLIARRTQELTAANERLETALAREQEVSELKSSFISTVSHEFRTPLGVILSSNGILKNYLDRLSPEKRAEHFEAIGKSVARMTEMVEDVLLFSRAEANRLDFTPRAVDPSAFLRLIVDEVRSATEQKCVIDLKAPGLPGKIMADEKLLRPILRNLLENAVKYSPQGSVVRLSGETKDASLAFEIADQGIGIPQADLARLGQAFIRARNAQDFKGTGLGLAIVQRCVARHGGTLHIDSQEGHGTTVRVELPFTQPPVEDDTLSSP